MLTPLKSFMDPNNSNWTKALCAGRERGQESKQKDTSELTTCFMIWTRRTRFINYGPHAAKSHLLNYNGLYCMLICTMWPLVNDTCCKHPTMYLNCDHRPEFVLTLVIIFWLMFYDWPFWFKLTDSRMDHQLKLVSRNTSTPTRVTESSLLPWHVPIVVKEMLQVFFWNLSAQTNRIKKHVWNVLLKVSRMTPGRLVRSVLGDIICITVYAGIALRQRTSLSLVRHRVSNVSPDLNLMMHKLDAKHVFQVSTLTHHFSRHVGSVQGEHINQDELRSVVRSAFQAGRVTQLVPGVRPVQLDHILILGFTSEAEIEPAELIIQRRNRRAVWSAHRERWATQVAPGAKTKTLFAVLHFEIIYSPFGVHSRKRDGHIFLPKIIPITPFCNTRCNAYSIPHTPKIVELLHERRQNIFWGRKPKLAD